MQEKYWDAPEMDVSNNTNTVENERLKQQQSSEDIDKGTGKRLQWYIHVIGRKKKVTGMKVQDRRGKPKRGCMR